MGIKTVLIPVRKAPASKANRSSFAPSGSGEDSESPALRPDLIENGAASIQDSAATSLRIEHMPSMGRLILVAMVLSAVQVSAEPLLDHDSTISHCRALKDERDRLAAEAMRAEIALVERYRDRFCPALNRQAQQANANDQVFPPLDYTALLRCRHQAEQQLERDLPVLERNSLGFTYYSPTGATAARQADQLRAQIAQLGCLP